MTDKIQLTSLFSTRISVKCLASLPKGSGATSVIVAEEAASRWADVKGARVSPEDSPFASSEGISDSATGSTGALLPIDGDW